MRKFYLHTAEKTQSFDLNVETALATEPQGLGISFDTTYNETIDGTFLTNVKPSFDPIVLKIYFNADGSSGYVNYKYLMSFLSTCGKSEFLFEYNDGVTDKYCGVIFKSLTKTEISEEGLFCETLTLERQTYFFEYVENTFIFGGETITPTFPLTFPFGFTGTTFSNEREINNDFYLPAPVELTIKGITFSDLSIYLKNTNNEIVSQILFNDTPPNNSTIKINPQTKKITVTDALGETTNGYDLTDKTKQSFLYIPTGNYIIGATITSVTGGEIRVSVRRYMYD